MTALSIALVVSVAVLCATRLYERWLLTREYLGQKIEEEMKAGRQALAETERRLKGVSDAHATWALRIEKLEADRARQEVWK